MDTRTAFVSAALLILANVVVLGLLHGRMPQPLRPGILAWLAGTMMLALAALLLGHQSDLSAWLGIITANSLLLFGLSSYWFALRQFYGFSHSPLFLLPALLGTLAIGWFALAVPHTGLRILVVGLASMFVLAKMLQTLHAQARRDKSLSRNVMSGLLMLVLVFAALRLGYYLQLGLPATLSIVSNDSWMNLFTPLLISLLPILGTTTFLLLCFERIQQQWELAASTDFLTGLANRRTLTELGSRRLAERSARRQGFGLALLDLDHFKQLNDRHGHDLGDNALKHVARVLKAHVRGLEVVARLGGEEFVVLLDLETRAQAETVGERLRLAIHQNPFRHEGLELPITVSVGVALRNQDREDSFEALLQRADQALYTAKTGGRNRVVVIE